MLLEILVSSHIQFFKLSAGNGTATNHVAECQPDHRLRCSISGSTLFAFLLAYFYCVFVGCSLSANTVEWCPASYCLARSSSFPRQHIVRFASTSGPEQRLIFLKSAWSGGLRDYLLRGSWSIGALDWWVPSLQWQFQLWTTAAGIWWQLKYCRYRRHRRHMKTWDWLNFTIDTWVVVCTGTCVWMLVGVCRDTAIEWKDFSATAARDFIFNISAAASLSSYFLKLPLLVRCR